MYTYFHSAEISSMYLVQFIKILSKNILLLPTFGSYIDQVKLRKNV